MLIDFIERTLYNKKKERSFWTSILIDISAILLWRGIWGLLDLYIFPNHATISFITSAVVGLISLLFIKKFSRR